MVATIARGIEGVRALPVGQSLGHSDWYEVTADAVEKFVRATGDHRRFPVGHEGTSSGEPATDVAPGPYTLSLVPRLLPEIIEFSGFGMVVNYGCERVRYLAPVPVGAKVRAEAVVDAVTEVKGGVQLTLTLTFVLAEGATPACVATIVARHYL
jgi:acyl dehydratase